MNPKRLTPRYIIISQWLSSVNLKKKVVARICRKGNTFALLVGSRLVEPLWKAVWRYLKKLKVEQLSDSVIPLLVIYSKKPKTLIQKT